MTFGTKPPTARRDFYKWHIQGSEYCDQENVFRQITNTFISKYR